MTAGGRVAILSLKHGRDQVAIRVRVLVPDGRAPSARDVLASVLRYILETTRAEPETVRELLTRQVGRKEAEEMMTTAERLRREGRIEGKIEHLGLCNTSIAEVRQAGARIRLITDGDVAPAVAATQPDTGIDMLMGTGGAPEGVIAAAAVRCMGGDMQGQLKFRSEEEALRAEPAMG